MFDKKIKSKLEGYEAPVNANLWNNIEQDLVAQGLTTSGSSFLLKKVFPFVGAGIIIGALYFLVDTTNDPSDLKNNEVITTTIIADSNSEIQSSVTHLNNSNPTQEADKFPVANIKDPLTSIKKATPVIQKESDVGETKGLVITEDIQTHPAGSEVSIVAPTASGNLEVKSNNIATTAEIEKAEVVDKIHAAGEYVTIRVDFQNYADEKSTHVKMWEEFPDWVDVRTFEMVDHKNSVKVRTRVIPSQNSVIWKVHGDFSNDVNSEDSKGYLEYKIQLTEPTRASELEKLQPEVQ